MHKHLLVAIVGVFGVAAQNASADSAGARSKRNFGLGLQAGGVMGAVTGAGEVVFNAGSYVQLALTYGRGKEDLTEDVEDGYVDYLRGKELPKTLPNILAVTFGPYESVTQEVEMTALRTRVFLPNSFFVSLGVAQRSQTITLEDDTAAPALGIEGAEVQLKVDALMSYVGIGSQWMWDNGFYLGADWLGGFRSLSHKRKASVTLVKTETEDEEVRFYQETLHGLLLGVGDEAGKEIGRLIDASVLAFMIGIAF